MEMHPAPFYADVANGPDTGTAHWLETSDGVRIRMAHWRVAQEKDAVQEKGTVLLFPGRTEYVEKYGQAAASFGERGYAMLAIDWRGQGLADRLIPNRAAGHIDDFIDYQKDIAAVLEAANALDLPKPYFLVGHSMGGCIGLRALEAGLPVNAVVFSAPMWGILISVAIRPAAWALGWGSKQTGMGHKMAPGTKPLTYVLAEPFEGNSLTKDLGMFDYMRAQVSKYPDLALGGPSMHWLHEALIETRNLAQLTAPDLPCLTFLGDNERIVDLGRIHNRMASWPKGTLEIVKGGEHEVMMEVGETRERFFDDSAAFFDSHL